MALSAKRLGVVLLLTLTAALATGSIQAQTSSDLAVARGDILAERQAIVAANVSMTETEAAAFWPLYREYRADAAKIGGKYLALIQEFATAWNGDSLDATVAVGIASEIPLVE